MMARTLRGRLTLLYVGLTFLTLLAVGGGVAIMIAVDVAEDNRERAEQHLPPEGLEPEQRTMLIALAIGIPIVLVVGGLGGWWVAGRALKPLGKINEVTEAISADDLQRRVPRGGGAEVDALAASLNQLLSRLERSLADVRSFTADAAHELRSPLASVMGRLEVTLRHPRGEEDLKSTIADALEELVRMRALLDGLLTLARSDAGKLRAESDPVDLAAVAARLVERDRPAAEDRAITLELSAAPAAARGDARLLERAIGNLVDNAVLHGKSGGKVALRVDTSGERARCTVEDDGPGIPEAEVPRLFSRFFRGDAARTRTAGAGFGLGLSIARTIVEVHGGSLTYAPRDGGGCVFTVDLPSA
jgi:heavy metal sensor kinase